LDNALGARGLTGYDELGAAGNPFYVEGSVVERVVYVFYYLRGV
jgi:hypothetical protein